MMQIVAYFKNNHYFCIENFDSDQREIKKTRRKSPGLDF